MIDPRQTASEALETLLREAGRQRLQPAQCMQMLDHLAWAPHLLRRVAHALSAQRTGAAVEALQLMPANVPGVVEGLYGAFAHGVCRRRRDGREVPAMLALDFKASRAQAFPTLLSHAARVFGDALEALVVDETPCFRFRLQHGRGTLAGRVAALSHEIVWLHERLGKSRGARLWLNGWCFPSDGKFAANVQVHWVRGWLAWASARTETLR